MILVSRRRIEIIEVIELVMLSGPGKWNAHRKADKKLFSSKKLSDSNWWFVLSWRYEITFLKFWWRRKEQPRPDTDDYQALMKIRISGLPGKMYWFVTTCLEDLHRYASKW